MKRISAATRGPDLEILGRPEGGLGETRPAVVSPSVLAKARRDVIATLHQLIDTLTAPEDEPRRDDASGVGRNLPLLLNAVEAGKLLSISRAKVLDMAARGQLPSIRVGGSVRFPRDRLISWIDDHFADIDGPARITLRPSRAIRGHPA
jgi:excisionase family DNA binding protein